MDVPEMLRKVIVHKKRIEVNDIKYIFLKFIFIKSIIRSLTTTILLLLLYNCDTSKHTR